MSNSSTTQSELIKEISALKKRIQELEKSEAEHKRTEEELRFSCRQLQLLINSGPDFFFLKDLDLRYQLVNAANAKFFGRRETDILGRTDFELMPEKSAAACQESDQLAIREKKIVVTVETVGDKFYETYKFPVIVEDNIVGIAGIIRDITDRKQVEVSLRDTQIRYRLLFEHAPDGIVIIDPTTARCLEFNEAARLQLGYSQEEFANLSIPDFEVVETPEETRGHIEKVIREGRDDFETKLRGKQGDIRNIYVTAQMTKLSDRAFYHCVWRDITDQKRTGAELAVSRDRLSRAEIISRSGNWEFDMKSNRVFASDGARRIYGLHDSEWTIPEVQKMPLPEYRGMLDNALRGLINGNRPYDVEFKIKRPDTGDIVDIHSVAEYDRERKVAFGIIQDITHHKLLESQLLHAQKLEAVGTLASGITHDFNNILMGIQGYVSLMMLELDTHHPHYERLKLIEGQVQSATDLTRQLLGFARSGRYEIRPADMNVIVRESSAMFGRTRKELMIHGNYENDLWTVEVDRGQIEQALLNLYVNAWHAMPTGGDIYIETGNVVLDKNYTAPHAASPGNYVRVSIVDTGMGMEEETIKRIFDPFFTTKEMGRGTGLGLAMVYGIMKGHKGIIDVMSKPGQGSTFTLYFPASEREVIEEKPAISEVLRGSEAILIVDDQPSILAVSKAILTSLGYTVHETKSGQEAITFLSEMKSNVDLVLLDMTMPGLSGGETFDRIRELNPTVKVILCSGYSLDRQAQQIMDKGCQGFIQKPFNIALISRKIREVLEK